MTDQHEPDIDIREIHVENLAGLMCRLENRHHKRGWRTSLMTAYVIFDRHRHRREVDILTRALGSIGPAIIVGRYGAQPMVADRLLAGVAVEPWKAFKRFAHHVAFIDPALLLAADDVEDAEDLAEQLDATRQLLQLPGIVGYAACYEGYGLEEISPALVDQALRDDLETVPGAREGRLLIAVDAGDHVHRVQRVRGHDQVVEMFVPLRGDTTTSLRKLMDLSMDRLPATQEEADARYERIGGRPVSNMFQARQGKPTG